MSHADIVNLWFRDRLASGAVARDTEAYNQVIAALPDLIARLDPAPAAIDAAKNDSSGTTDAADQPETPPQN